MKIILSPLQGKRVGTSRNEDACTEIVSSSNWSPMFPKVSRRQIHQVAWGRPGVGIFHPHPPFPVEEGWGGHMPGLDGVEGRCEGRGDLPAADEEPPVGEPRGLHSCKKVISGRDALPQKLFERFCGRKKPQKSAPVAQIPHFFLRLLTFASLFESWVGE